MSVSVVWPVFIVVESHCTVNMARTREVSTFFFVFLIHRVVLKFVQHRYNCTVNRVKTEEARYLYSSLIILRGDGAVSITALLLCYYSSSS